MAEKGKVAPAPPGPPRKGTAVPTGNARVDAMQKRAQAMASGNGPKVSARQFLEEAWVELKKTTWPNRTVLVKSTTVVLALVVAVAVWDGLIDSILTHTLDKVFGALR